MHSDFTEETESDDETDSYTTQEDCVQILHQAVAAYYVARELHNKLSKTAALNNRDIFFSTFMATVLNQLCRTGEDSGQHNTRLSSLLNSWNLKRVQVGDGNCLFVAVGHSLLHQISNGDQAILNILSSLGANKEQIMNISYLQEFLRKAMHGS